MMSIRWTFLWVMVLLATLQQVSYARNATEVYTPNDEEVSPASRSLQGTPCFRHDSVPLGVFLGDPSSCAAVQISVMVIALQL